MYGVLMNIRMRNYYLLIRVTVPITMFAQCDMPSRCTHSEMFLNEVLVPPLFNVNNSSRDTFGGSCPVQKFDYCIILLIP